MELKALPCLPSPKLFYMIIPITLHISKCGSTGLLHLEAIKIFLLSRILNCCFKILLDGTAAKILVQRSIYYFGVSLSEDIHLMLTMKDNDKWLICPGLWGEIGKQNTYDSNCLKFESWFETTA